MIAPIMLEEVQAVLAINSEHSHKVGRVSAIAEELDTHTRLHVGRLSVYGGGTRHANVASVTALENASIRMISMVYPSNLANVTDRMNGLVPAACD